MTLAILQDWIETPAGVHDANPFSKRLTATEVTVTAFPLDRIADFYDGYIFVGGAASTIYGKPERGRAERKLYLESAPGHDEKWMSSFPRNRGVSSGFRVFWEVIGYNRRNISRVAVSHVINTKWYEREIDGRHFYAYCRLSQKMAEVLRHCFPPNETPCRETFEHVVVLPMPHACEPDDTPLDSPKELEPMLHRPLNAFLIGHLDSATQRIKAASLIEEKVAMLPSGR